MMGYDVYTLGELSSLWGLSTSVLRNYCDRGMLKCYRIPGGRHRRVREADARAFAEKYGLHWPGEEKGGEQTETGNTDG